MPRSCPDCGAAIELAEQPTVLLTGNCSSCGKAVTVVAGAQVTPGTAGSPPGGEEGGSERPTARGAGPECPQCGGPLSVELEGRRLTLSCDSCDTTLEFSQRGAPDGSEERSVGRGFDRGRGGEGPAGPRRPTSRPCRQCGAPLRFFTDENGLLTGECDSCGNRFTLPPRREPRGGDRFDRPPPKGRPRKEFGGARGYRYGGGARRTDRRPYASRDSDSGDERPRRRPRRD